MEKEMRKVYFENLQKFNLNEQTEKLKKRIEEIFVYEYKISKNIEGFLQTIDILSKKIMNKYIKTLTDQLEEKIYYINKMDNDISISNKEQRTEELLNSKISFSPENIIEDFMEENLRTFKRLSEQRSLEYLYTDLKKCFLKYNDEVEETILENNNLIKKDLQSINLLNSKEDLQQSKSAMMWEMFGIYLDDNTKKLWMYEDNMVDKRVLKQRSNDGTVFEIDNERNFVISKNPNCIDMSILNCFDVEKQIKITNDEINCKINDSVIAHLYKENKIHIKNKEEQASFDLNEMSREESEQLRHMLTEISPDVKNYFERINVVKSYASMFK